jgi:hypothetical protein
MAFNSLADFTFDLGSSGAAKTGMDVGSCFGRDAFTKSGGSGGVAISPVDLASESKIESSAFAAPTANASARIATQPALSKVVTRCPYLSPPRNRRKTPWRREALTDYYDEKADRPRTASREESP